MLNQLKILDFSDNELQEIPDSLRFPSSLEHLQLSGNNIKNLPANFASLANLTYLDLSQNPLGEIPSAISSLAKLNNLLLNEANIQKLTNLPPHLQELSVSRNNISHISDQETAPILNLRKFYLFHNPLDSDTTVRLGNLFDAAASNVDVRWDENNPPAYRWDE